MHFAYLHSDVSRAPSKPHLNSISMPLELKVKEEVYYAFKILRIPANDVYHAFSSPLKCLGTSLLLSLFFLIVLYLFVFIFVIEQVCLMS